MNTENNPPLAEPPPSTTDESDLQQWMSDVYKSIIDNDTSNNINDNTKLVKPTISSLVFENEMECNLTKYDIESSKDNQPINYILENTIMMDLQDINEDTSHSLCKEINTNTQMEVQHTVTDSIINSLRTKSDNWRPTLNKIVEETLYDVMTANDNITIKDIQAITSGKERQS